MINNIEIVICPKCLEVDKKINCFLSENEFQCNECNTKFTIENNYVSRISDGYHSFDELYFHRMILFSIICRKYRNKAWKSLFHHDNTMFNDMFIVGINTPDGQYTYHYNIKYWNYFLTIKTLKNAPEYDGHKPENITRLFSLEIDIDE
jgi:hypothetical protein